MKKISGALLSVIYFLSVSAAAFLCFERNAEVRKRRSAEAEFRKASAELTALKKEKSDLESKLKDAKAALQEEGARLEEEKKRMEVIVSKSDLKERKAQAVKKFLKEELIRKKKISEDLVAANKELEAAKSSIAQLDEEKRGIQERLELLEERSLAYCKKKNEAKSLGTVVIKR